MALEDLVTARDNMEAIVAAQTAAWVTAGCPPTFSVDGESYDWNNWLQAKADAIRTLTELIQSRQGPFVIRSRGRP